MLAYYSSIILNSFDCLLLFSKLCQQCIICQGLIGEKEPSITTNCFALDTSEQVGVNSNVNQFLKERSVGHLIKSLLHIQKDHMHTQISCPLSKASSQSWTIDIRAHVDEQWCMKPHW